ncbi:MAG: TetR/AcrR family transcriptional regulator [Firmicutes bacterium HGW-Firmicutes-15]|nr:MAG: TetR/AcrR family transcriptional regulator [Firmicutes bacterium HGW-Firmicutes-15]
MRRKDDNKQQNIKQAVIKLILAEGFHGASISKIAKEAGVSPATVYVYYDSKDSMLNDIYREYYEEVYTYLYSRVRTDMSGEQFIESLVRAYYTYIIEYGEEFYFVEQFSSCPALVNGCKVIEGKSKITLIFDDLKARQIIKDVDNATITAILFNPVKSIAVRYHNRKDAADPMLDDLIRMIKDALLR